MRTFGIQSDWIWFQAGWGYRTKFWTFALHFSADIFLPRLTQRGFSVLIRDPQLLPHPFSCGCVCGRPLWKPPGLWSRPAAPPSGRWPQGRCPSGCRWSRFCCSWAGPRCRDACGLCSSPGSPAGDRDSWLSTFHSHQNKGKNLAALPFFSHLNILIISNTFASLLLVRVTDKLFPGNLKQQFHWGIPCMPQ